TVDESRVRGWGDDIVSLRTYERRVLSAFGVLLNLGREMLPGADYDVSVLSLDHPAWQGAVDEILLPAWRAMFEASAEDWLRERGLVAALPPPYDYRISADGFMNAVRNRLVRVADPVFDVMRGTLNAARADNLDQRQVARQVDALLRSTNQEVWRNRAATIARTEVFAARNAGHHASALATAQALDVAPSQVAKRWRASADERTRATHAEADRTVVVGLDTPLIVGDAQLQFPGDPDGPGREVINCRCWLEYLMPGDPGYPGSP
ncbi:MAG: phage head morphogenesis protein, partial [Promicromonosporaceae bacterium]|nr:phage head morphogenesis protein [Promicromonosporaceae bacterium]